MTTLPTVPGVSIRLIQRIVCQRFKLPLETMQSPSRKHEHAHPRQIAMRLSREFTTKSLPTIGRYFGGRDHSTILWALESVERRNRLSEDARRHYAELRAALELICPRPAALNVPDLYAELGLEPGATSEEIKAAHRRKVWEHHPDRGGDAALFQAANGAYRALLESQAQKKRPGR